MTALLATLLVSLWTAAPGPQSPPPAPADPAFDALVKAPAFGVPARDLAKLRPFGDASFDAILSDVEVIHDNEGRTVRRSRFVYRVNDDDAVQEVGTREFDYAAWHEARPELKVRIVSPTGEETWLDPTTVSERVGRVDGLVIDDHRTLVAPLPGLGAGAIVEELLTTTETRAAFPGAPYSSRHHFGTNTRFQRLVVSAPGTLEHAVANWGGAMPKVSKVDGRTVLSAERRPVGKPDPRTDISYIEWSLGGTWQAAAAAYAAQIKAPSGGTPPAELTKKGLEVDGVMKAVAAKMRYTGLSLGEASVVPYAPADVWKRAYGDCKDVSLLVVKSLETQGIKASLALLRTGFGDDVLPGIAGLNRFNHAIVYVHPQAGQAARWIDTTAPELAPGILPAATLERWALVIDGATTGLIKTPGRAEHLDRMHAETRIEGVPMGRAKVTETVRWEGAIAGHNEPRHRGLDEKKLKAELAWLTSRFDVKEPSAVKVEGGPGQKSLVVSATFESEKHWLGYENGSWNLDIYAHLVQFVPDYLINATEPFPYRHVRRRVLSHSVRIVPPTGFVVTGDHLENRDIRVGPATWSERYVREGKELVVTASLDFGELDWTAEQSKAFRESWKELMQGDMTSVFLVEEASDHFERGELKEALAVLRDRLAKNKKDVDARSRLAYIASQMGLVEVARAEAAQALKDDPKGALTLFGSALVGLTSPVGVEFGEGFDRVGTLAVSRALVALDPKSMGYRYVLGRALTTDAKGHPTVGPERIEGIAVLKALALEGHVESMGLWAFAAAQLGQWKELAETVPKLKGFTQAAAFHATGIAGHEGADGLRKALPAITSDRATQAQIVEAAVGFLSIAREYDGARAVSAAFTRDFPSLSKQRQLIAQANRVPYANDYSTPEAALGSLLTAYIKDYAASGASDSEEEPNEYVAALGTLKTTLGSGGLAFALDLVWGLSRRQVDGSDALGWRVKLVDTSGHMPSGLTTFWKRNGAKLEQVPDSYGSGLGAEALRRLAAGDLDGARQWLGWFSDSLGSADFEGWKTRWPNSASLTASEVELAASTIAVMSTTAPARSVEVMRTRLAEIPRGLRLAAYHSLVLHAYAANDFKGLAELWKQLPGTLEPEQDEWMELVRMHIKARALKAARDLIDELINKAPNSAFWLTEKADVLTYEGKLDEAAALFEELHQSGRLTGMALNQYAWLEVVRGKVDEKVVAIARGAATEAKKNAASERIRLNTLAMVHLDRGELSEAITAFRGSVERPSNLEGHDELILARLAEKLGFQAWAKATYKKVASEKDRYPTSVPALAAKYLAAM